ncbi:hypothetical protein GC105_09145 [Alkalibaculum sp. M08DMB]|uniref:Zinc ribbon domain-containing protein n=1 Tax=Alkalibaculum sporogenes TaxID=2655001 RepID=A0A6A7K9C5_9FIRM|nr:hypothetical protein [Alkalibaculum sporogenes]
MKICLNCGDKLLVLAKKCPTCGTKDKDFPLIDKNDKVRISEIVSGVPCPKGNLKPQWQKNTLEKKSGFWANLNEQAQEINRANAQEKQAQQERISQMDREGIAYCPKCHSTSLTAHKKGFGIGKAVIGASLTAPIGGGIIGAIAGNMNAKKVRVTCLKCGHQFWAGKK